jgi:hypothetical protein
MFLSSARRRGTSGEVAHSSSTPATTKRGSMRGFAVFGSVLSMSSSRTRVQVLVVALIGLSRKGSEIVKPVLPCARHLWSASIPLHLQHWRVCWALDLPVVSYLALRSS